MTTSIPYHPAHCTTIFYTPHSYNHIHIHKCQRHISINAVEGMNVDMHSRTPCFADVCSCVCPAQQSTPSRTTSGVSLDDIDSPRRYVDSCAHWPSDDIHAVYIRSSCAHVRLLFPPASRILPLCRSLSLGDAGELEWEPRRPTQIVVADPRAAALPVRSRRRAGCTCAERRRLQDPITPPSEGRPLSACVGREVFFAISRETRPYVGVV